MPLSTRWRIDKGKVDGDDGVDGVVSLAGRVRVEDVQTQDGVWVKCDTFSSYHMDALAKIAKQSLVAWT